MRWMRIEDEFPELPSKLLGSDGLKPVFFIINDLRNKGPSKMSTIANEVLQEVLSLNSEGAQISDSRFVKALYPVVANALEIGTPEDQANALWALAILLKHQLLDESPAVSKFLSSSDEDILQKSVWVVQMYAHREIDISEYIPLIESLLQHQNYWIRHMASSAICDHEIRIGEASRLSVLAGVKEYENLDSYWTIAVSHRRLHAINDTSKNQPDNVVHFTPERMCGVCGHKGARCIFYWDDSGTGWRDRTSEYCCPECGNYTTYHYFD